MQDSTKKDRHTPRPLPRGMTEFNELVEDVKALDNIANMADDRSIRFVIATLIINLGHETSDVPLDYFATQLKIGAAKEIASKVFQTIKAEQKAELEEAKRLAAMKPTEDSVATSATDEPK